MIGVRPPEHDPAAPQQSTTLPVGSPGDRARPTCASWPGGTARAFALLMAVNTVAVIASMVGPTCSAGWCRTCPTAQRDVHLRPHRRPVPGRPAGAGRASCGWCRLRGAMLGERMLADLREDFLVRSVALPPGVLERAGTGDLLSRITTDIDRLANAMREAVPRAGHRRGLGGAAARRARP